MPESLFNEVVSSRCFPVNFVEFLRTPFLAEHLPLLSLSTKLSETLVGNGGS